MKIKASYIKDRVYSVSSDGTKSVYDLKGNLIDNLIDRKVLDIYRSSYIDIGKKYIVRSNDTCVYIHDINTDNVIFTFDFPNTIYLKLFNDSLLAIIDKNFNLTIINILINKTLLNLPLHPSFITFEFNNNTLVIGYNDKIEVRGMSGEEIDKIEIPYKGELKVEEIYIYNSLILFSIDKGYVYIWNSNSRLITSIPILEEGCIKVIRPYIYNGGLYICMGDRKGEIKIWNTRSKKVVNYYLHEGNKEIEELLLVNNRSNLISLNEDNSLKVHNIKGL